MSGAYNLQKVAKCNDFDNIHQGQGHLWGVNQEYLPLAEMTKCCDLHDICYDTCNTDKEKCDLEFKRCLYKYCDTYQTTGITIVNTCKAAAKILFTGTTALGCKSFLDAQREACYCPDKSSRNKKPKKAAQSGEEL